MARDPLSAFRAGGLSGGADPFRSLHREMNRLFDDVMRGGTGQTPAGQRQPGQGAMLLPQMDVSETNGELKICVELPGVSQNDVDIRLDDDMLVIQGEKKPESQQENERYHFVERSYGTFQRALRLPYPIDPEKVQARFDDGVLTITLPRPQQQERSRRIHIQSGSGGGQGKATQIEGERLNEGEKGSSRAKSGKPTSAS
jgi:HSP20 family protein